MNTFEKLPEECLTQILSMLTTPRDVIRSSAVSKAFLASSVSDTVWDTFVPSDFDDIVCRSSSTILRDGFTSKKDLFMYLCHYFVLLDDSTKSFALDKWSGKIRYMLGSRALTIVWGSSPEYWRWESILESRFPECAVLEYVRWLDIKGKIHTKLLSPGTTYGAYFVFKMEANTYCFGMSPAKVWISEVAEDGLPGNNHATEIKRFYLKPPSPEQLRVQGSPRGDLPAATDDGWSEIEMGRFQVGVNDGGGRVVFEMALIEDSSQWKKGLVVHGIESFALDKWSGKTCYMLGARELSVIWGSNNGYWSWEYVPESRTRDDNHITEIKRFYLKAPSSDEEYGQFNVRRTQRFIGELPVIRDDGWMEIEMGKYQVGVRGADEKGALEMTLKEVEISHWKLVVHGVEVRPLC